ncbi:UNVERIFIED_CONTAM: hypothetical protein Sradi_6770700 [Sesamum radiatum]|uniref:Uncharacterized protein n=1 Tax=Sesamum radiatum TaxID=300843 RepID=A0AAW2JSE3_SESRA
MSLSAAEDDSASEIHLPADVDWEMLDKSKFFFLGAALFSGVSGVLGMQGILPWFWTSLMGTIPARALYMGALEVTKSNVGNVASSKLGFSEASASAVANAAAGVSAAMAAQMVWTPIDVVSQRLMVQGGVVIQVLALLA